MSRLNLVLVLLLAGLVAANLAGRAPRVLREDSVALIAEELLARVAAVRVEQGSDTALLEREGQPGEVRWVLPGLERLPARPELISAELARLERVRVIDRLGPAGDAERYGLLGPDARTVRLLNEAGELLVEFTQAPLPGARGRTGGCLLWPAGGDIYDAPELRLWLPTDEAYLDTQLLDFEVGRVAGLRVLHAGELQLDARRQEAGGWRGRDDAVLPTMQVEPLLATLRRLPHVGLIGSGAETPAMPEPADWRFELTLEPGPQPGSGAGSGAGSGVGPAEALTQALVFGPPLVDGDRPARRVEWDADWIVRAPAAAIADLFGRLERLGVR